MATTSATKPAKPYREFPLFAHPNGQWCKKIKGKAWYFGKWADHQAALLQYLSEVDDIRAGRDPRRQGVATPADELTVADMLNHFLIDKAHLKGAGEISERTFSDYQKSCKTVVEHFGRFTVVASLRAADFGALRKAFPETWGPTKTGTEIQRMRTAFKWAAESELIPALPNFGPGFKKPQKAVVRRAKADRQSEHGTLDFTSMELKALLEASDGWLKAAILLGVNAGFGASDCGRLRVQNIDFAGGWYDLPRRKTAIPRRFYVWKETRDAIRAAMQSRPLPQNDDHGDLCFLTSHGKPVWWETDVGAKCDNVGKAFQKLCKKLVIHKPGRSYYSLRRTYETVAGNSKDQVAVNYAMGHSDESMAAIYRQGIDDERSIAVAEHVRQWLFDE